MSNLKKTAVAVLALSSSAVFAGTMGPVCVPGSVTVPCEATAWDFGAQALYLHPTVAGDLSYAVPSQNVAGVDSYYDNNPNWGWGFQIEGSYHYGTGNDFDVNWYHFNNATSANYNGSVQNIDIDALTVNTIFDSASINPSIHPEWDQVNFEFGQHVDFSDYAKARFHAGAEYARVNANGVVNAGWVDQNDVLAPTTTYGVLYQQTWSSTYNGGGPRAGLDLMYNFGNGVNVYGKAAASVLVGNVSWNGGRAVNINTYAEQFLDGCWSGSQTRVVPELEGKLGANYTWAMSYGDITFDVGYMWLNYFNVLQGRLLDPVAEVSSGVNGGTLVEPYKTDKLGISDFAMNGVYFGLKWLGNVA